MARLESRTEMATGTGRKQPLRLWLRLLACENIIEQHIRTSLREQFGITLPQFDVLAELEYLGQPLTMTELSTRLMVSNGNVTGVVDRLVRLGYVERLTAPDDRRVHLIQLTQRGLDAFRTMADSHETWISNMLSGVQDEDLAQLLELLSRTHDVLKAKYKESAPP